MKKQIVTSRMHKAAFHVCVFIIIFLVFSFCGSLQKGWILYILFITSNIRSIAMFVIVDLRSVFYTLCVAIFMMYCRVRVYLSGSNNSLVINRKP
jgi:hypothetical protein